MDRVVQAVAAGDNGLVERKSRATGVRECEAEDVGIRAGGADSFEPGVVTKERVHSAVAHGHEEDRRRTSLGPVTQSHAAEQMERWSIPLRAAGRTRHEHAVAR